MLKKKTKRGVDIKQTLGMKEREPDSTWVLVVHRSRASLFLYERMSASFQKLQDLFHPEGRKLDPELTDRPGRSSESADRVGGRYGMGAPRHATISPSEGAMRRLVRQCAGWLEAGHATHSFSSLVLVAETQCLGHLRTQLRSPLRAAVAAEHEKDYSWLTENELKERLRGLLAPRPALSV